MNDQADDFDQADEEILSYTVSDETLVPDSFLLCVAATRLLGQIGNSKLPLPNIYDLPLRPGLLG